MKALSSAFVTNLVKEIMSYRKKGAFVFPNDWCVAYDTYSRAIPAGSSASPSIVGFYKVGGNVPSTCESKRVGGSNLGNNTGYLSVKNAGKYRIFAFIQMQSAGTDTSFIVRVNSDTDTATYLNKFTIPKGGNSIPFNAIFDIPANATIGIYLVSTGGITTVVSPNASGNNSGSASCYMSIERIA